MYPVAYWHEDTFLSFYVAIFLALFVTADLLMYRYEHVWTFARWGIGVTVIVLATAHLSTDYGTDRIRKHWTGRAPVADTLAQEASQSQTAEYQHYWGKIRRVIPFFPKSGRRRLVLLPFVFLVAFIASQIHFRKRADNSRSKDDENAA